MGPQQSMQRTTTVPPRLLYLAQWVGSIHLNIIVYGRSLPHGCEHFSAACREIQGGGEKGKERRKGGGAADGGREAGKVLFR